MILSTREHKQLAGRRSVELSADIVRSYDVTLIATDHDEIDYVTLANWSRMIVDTRNACGRHGIKGSHIVPA